MKLKAIRVLDQEKGDAERLDLINRMKAADVNSIAEAVDRIIAGTPAEKAISEFVDTFDLTPTKDARYASLEVELTPTTDDELNAFVGGVDIA